MAPCKSKNSSKSKKSKPTKAINKSKNLKKGKPMDTLLELALTKDIFDPPTEWERTKFENIEVQSYHDKWVMDRNFIQEREFPYHSSPGFYLMLQNKHKADELAQRREKGCRSLVREYYAHAAYSKSLKCNVRGCMIKIDEATIRALYALSPVQNCHYTQSKTNPEPTLWDDVLKGLTLPNQQKWYYKSRWGKYLKRAQLNLEAHYWHHFVANNVMPISHLNNICDDRALLIFHLLRGNSVDFAAIMFRTLEAHIYDHTLQIVFPHLIYKLCSQQVQIAPYEEEFKPLSKFNYKSIKGHEAVDVAGQPQGDVGEQNDVNLTAEQAPPPPEASDIMAALNNLTARVDRIEKWVLAIAKAVNARLPSSEDELSNDGEEG